MDILSLFILVFAIIKKDKRCFLMCVVASVYCFMHSIFTIPQMMDSAFYQVFRFINVPLLGIVLVTSVLTFRKPFENDKQYVFPIVFSAGALFAKILRKVFFNLQLRHLRNMAEVDADFRERYRGFTVGCTIMDVLHAVFFLGLLVCLIIILNRKPIERNS